MFEVPGMHVTEVQVDDQQRLVLTVESDWLEHGCPGCGVLAVGHGRVCRMLHDAPSLGRVTVVRCLSRVWSYRRDASRDKPKRWWRTNASGQVVVARLNRRNQA
jgi:hypothetical protein